MLEKIIRKFYLLSRQGFSWNDVMCSCRCQRKLNFSYLIFSRIPNKYFFLFTFPLWDFTYWYFIFRIMTNWNVKSSCYNDHDVVDVSGIRTLNVCITQQTTSLSHNKNPIIFFFLLFKAYNHKLNNFLISNRVLNYIKSLKIIKCIYSWLLK